MIGGSAPGNKSESNVGELWHTRLCGWPTAQQQTELILLTFESKTEEALTAY